MVYKSRLRFFNHYVYQYINERFDDIRLDLHIRRGLFSGVNREVYSIRQSSDMEHILFIRVRDFFGNFDGGIANIPRIPVRRRRVRRLQFRFCFQEKKIVQTASHCYCRSLTLVSLKVGYLYRKS